MERSNKMENPTPAPPRYFYFFISVTLQSNRDPRTHARPPALPPPPPPWIYARTFCMRSGRGDGGAGGRRAVCNIKYSNSDWNRFLAEIMSRCFFLFFFFHPTPNPQPPFPAFSPRTRQKQKTSHASRSCAVQHTRRQGREKKMEEQGGVGGGGGAVRVCSDQGAGR
jgi:hypothetical protein